MSIFNHTQKLAVFTEMTGSSIQPHRVNSQHGLTLTRACGLGDLYLNAYSTKYQSLSSKLETTKIPA